MNIRRKCLGIMLAPTLVLVAPSAPSGSAEVAAAAFGSDIDAAGDVGDCRGDITSSGVANRTTGPSISVRVHLACPPTPIDARWSADTSAAWHVETTGDGVTDYLLTMRGGSPTTLEDRFGRSVECALFGGVAHDGNGENYSAGVAFDGDCIGAPTSLRVGVSMRWAGGAVDQAPDDGGFGRAVVAGSQPSPTSAPPPPPPPPAPARQGYWMIGRTGDTYAFGDAGWHGNPSNVPGEIVDIEPTLDGRGYWAIDSLGHLYAFGTAAAFSALPDASESPTQARPGERMTSLSRAVQYVSGSGVPPRVSGLWGFTSRGRVVRYGNPPVFGDMSGKPLNGEVMDSVATPDGGGYYIVASDGGIFTFGNAEFLGSMGSTPLNAPVQSLVPDSDGRGYWLVASDGGIFTFDANFLGSMGATRLNKPITGMVSFASGYLMVATDGGIFTFGDAPFFGSLGADPPAQPVVAVAVLDDPGGYR